MEITARGLWTMVHGMGFGALYLMACSGAIMGLYRCIVSPVSREADQGYERFLKGYLVAMVVLAWCAVLTGAYIVYPWYRAVPPPGTVDLSMFPQRLLMSSPNTAGWHSLGMEWKEYVAWFAPISITMVMAVFVRYGGTLRNHRQLRNAVLSFAAASFLAAGVAGFFGATINKNAPVYGGKTIQLAAGERD
jgi:hypothetical protein